MTDLTAAIYTGSASRTASAVGTFRGWTFMIPDRSLDVSSRSQPAPYRCPSSGAAAQHSRPWSSTACLLAAPAGLSVATLRTFLGLHRLSSSTALARPSWPADPRSFGPLFGGTVAPRRRPCDIITLPTFLRPPLLAGWIGAPGTDPIRGRSLASERSSTAAGLFPDAVPNRQRRQWRANISPGDRRLAPGHYPEPGDRLRQRCGHAAAGTAAVGVRQRSQPPYAQHALAVLAGSVERLSLAPSASVGRRWAGCSSMIPAGPARSVRLLGDGQGKLTTLGIAGASQGQWLKARRTPREASPARRAERLQAQTARPEQQGRRRRHAGR